MEAFDVVPLVDWPSYADCGGGVGEGERRDLRGTSSIGDCDGEPSLGTSSTLQSMSIGKPFGDAGGMMGEKRSSSPLTMEAETKSGT